MLEKRQMGVDVLHFRAASVRMVKTHKRGLEWESESIFRSR